MKRAYSIVSVDASEHEGVDGMAGRDEGAGRVDERLADLADLIVSVARRIHTHAHDDDRVVSLTMTESAVMRYVGKHPGATPSEAAAAVRIQRSNVSAALRKLESEGLIELGRDERDARGVRLRATPRADANLRLLRSGWAEQLGVVRGDPDLDAGIRLLERLERGFGPARDEPGR